MLYTILYSGKGIKGLEPSTKLFTTKEEAENYANWFISNDPGQAEFSSGVTFFKIVSLHEECL